MLFVRSPSRTALRTRRRWTLGLRRSPGGTCRGRGEDDGWPPPNMGWQPDCPPQHAVLRAAACHPQCPARDTVARDPEHAERETHREDQHGRSEQHRGEHCPHVDRERRHRPAPTRTRPEHSTPPSGSAAACRHASRGASRQYRSTRCHCRRNYCNRCHCFGGSRRGPVISCRHEQADRPAVAGNQRYPSG
jgi:hypothetical protein